MLYCDKKFIGKKLREYRKNANLTQEEISSRVNIDEKHYGKLERGIFFPSLETFFKLIDVLQIPISEFGIELKDTNNPLREKLISEIYLLNDKELAAYLNIFKSIKELRK